MINQNKDRPQLPNLILDNTKEIEQFQNGVLRPIIKQQHDLLISFFQSSLEKRKVDVSSIKIETLENHIKNCCKKDIAFKNVVVGIITGHFTVEEYKRYEVNTSEYNRRILQIAMNRLLSVTSEIIQ